MFHKNEANKQPLGKAIRNPSGALTSGRASDKRARVLPCPKHMQCFVLHPFKSLPHKAPDLELLFAGRIIIWGSFSTWPHFSCFPSFSSALLLSEWCWGGTPGVRCKGTHSLNGTREPYTLPDVCVCVCMSCEAATHPALTRIWLQVICIWIQVRCLTDCICINIRAEPTK